jgi:phytoene synthase
MFAARRLYAEIGREVARRGLDSVNGRAIVSWQRKARVLSESMMAAAGRYPMTEKAHALPEASYLVDSVPAMVQEQPARRPRIEDRVAWLVDLFERLEQRDQLAGRSLQ